MVKTQTVQLLSNHPIRGSIHPVDKSLSRHFRYLYDQMQKGTTLINEEIMLFLAVAIIELQLS